MSRASALAAVETDWTPSERSALGLLVFVAAETMFFAGLISTHLILRAGSDAWPPLGQPRLPIAVTAVNTGVLLMSALTMRLALGAVRRGRSAALVRALAVTAALGAGFLIIQGIEWLALLRHGLQAGTPYGSTFFALIGAHALHVAGALGALLVVLRRATGGAYTSEDHGGVELCWIYWCFVTALWPILYVLVYLT